MGMYRSKQEDLESVFMKDCGFITVGEDGGLVHGVWCVKFKRYSVKILKELFWECLRFYLIRRWFETLYSYGIWFNKVLYANGCIILVLVYSLIWLSDWFDRGWIVCLPMSSIVLIKMVCVFCWLQWFVYIKFVCNVNENFDNKKK